MPLARWWNRFTRRKRPAPAQPPASTKPTNGADATAALAAASAIATPAADELRRAEDADPQTTQERHLRFFCWMVGLPSAPVDGAASSADIATLMERLDQITASESLRAGLLPRTPHVVPQLMKTLRDEHYSSADVASRISKDATLTAEVVRSATSAFQRGSDNDDEGEIDLAGAVAMIGTQGLRRAIANVVLRPIFDARGDTLSARAAVQIWKDADKKARLCAALASQHGLDPFDGYLAGLLHNSGWTAALRAIDGFQDMIVGVPDLARADVVPQLLRRRDALFGAFVATWQLSPALDEVAAEVGSRGIDGVQSRLGLALRDAERLAAMHVLAPPGARPGASVPMWASLPKPVQDCCATLARA